MKILVTGAAGFIGFHLANKLALLDHEIVGLDNINDYYSVELKKDRLAELGFNKNDITDSKLIQSSKYKNLKFVKLALEDFENLDKIFSSENFDIVINLAAQAGVTYSLINPRAYINSNIVGFFNILELSKNYSIKHLIYASSSSVYGMNKEYPFSETDRTDHPMSLYAATKKSDELFAFTYSYLHNINTTGLRFFTVYGPWGRPDMMPFKTVENVVNGKEITLYNDGHLWRDYTYVDDIIEGIVKLLGKDNLSKTEGIDWRIYNIGHGSPMENIEFINTIAKEVGKEALIKSAPAPKTEVDKTFANTGKLDNEVDYKPQTDVAEGIRKLVEWYKTYYKVQ